MDLSRLQANWDRLGRDDPLWAILSDPAKQGNRWDEEAFLQSGRDDARALIDGLGADGVPLLRERALDFGCGVGRLTLALAEHFGRVDGVDIAPSMIARARAWNTAGDRIRYSVNDVGSLALFCDATFDLVFSVLVLQHIAPRYSLRYIAEFLRVTRPGGCVVFQVPSHAKPVSPLPDRAFVADISHVDGLRRTIRAGARETLQVDVRNRGSSTWPVGHGVKLGNHWGLAGGPRIVNDDGRAPLLRDLPPGGSECVELTVTAPSTPGRYMLELDMVQEGVAWFGDRGSPLAVIDVTVEPGASAAATPATPSPDIGPAVIEMHALREAFVRDLIAYSGGRLISVREDGRAGPEWVSLTYVATV